MAQPTTTANTSDAPTLIALVAKTWEMVTAGHDEIGFSDDGAYIVVHNTERCAIHVMPQYFNHKVYASWVRGINACGFHKVPGRDHRWHHPDFHRDHPERLELIKRRPPPARGRPGTGGGSRRTKAATSAAAPEAAAPSTAIVPHVPLSVADLHPERLQLQQAMAEEAHLERAVAQIREEDFWQRFEAVRMVHMMLMHHTARQNVEAAPKTNPTITVLHPTLAPEASCPLLQLFEGTAALKLCDKTASDKAEGDKTDCDEMMDGEPLPLVASSEEVQRLLDEHGIICEACEEDVIDGGKPSGCDKAVEGVPLPLPVPLERVCSGSSSATADLPDGTDHADNALSQSKANVPSSPLSSSLPSPPTLADLPLPAPLPAPRTAMVPRPEGACALETMRSLAGVLPVLDKVCGSPACPLSRYGAHTHKTCDSLPPVGSEERQFLEEYVDRCFSTMSAGIAGASLAQQMVECA